MRDEMDLCQGIIGLTADAVSPISLLLGSVGQSISQIRNRGTRSLACLAENTQRRLQENPVRLVKVSRHNVGERIMVNARPVPVLCGAREAVCLVVSSSLHVYRRSKAGPIRRAGGLGVGGLSKRQQVGENTVDSPVAEFLEILDIIT